MKSIVNKIQVLTGLTLAIFLGLSLTVLAAPPGSPYSPTETLSPSCAPGATNCTVRVPAISGSNADITSLSGLTTALTVAQGGTGTTSFLTNGVLLGNGVSALQTTATGTAYQIFRVGSGGGSPAFGAIDISQAAAVTGNLAVANGGTGASTASAARTALSAAAAGANSDITSLTGLTTALTVGQGGTGSTTPSGARIVLGAAASGANSDITSLTALATPLSVTQGGTGLNSISPNTLLYASATNTLSSLALGTNGQVLQVVGGVLSWGSATGTAYTAGTDLLLTGSQFSVTEASITISNLGGVLGASHGGTGTSTVFTTGSVLFATAGGVHSQNNSGLFWDNTNSRLGINTTTPANGLAVVGTISGTHLKGLGAAPTVATGSGAGTGSPSVTVTGTDTAGEITLNTGTLPAISSTVLTLTFASAYGSSPHVIFVPSNTLSALLSGVSMIYVTTGTSNFTFGSGTTGLTGGSTYKWHYLVIE